MSTWENDVRDHGYVYAHFLVTPIVSGVAQVQFIGHGSEIDFDPFEEEMYTIQLWMPEGLGVPRSCINVWFHSSMEANHAMLAFDKYLEVINGNTGNYPITDISLN